MKKRLDIQSLLENSQKQDLVLFLKNSFANHPELADHFLIHFAATFELDETEFQLIMNRIERLFPDNLSSLTHRKANQIKDHLKNLVEQARDCLSREDYRQAFMIISHNLKFLDHYSDLLPEKFRFKPLQDRCFQMLDSIYRESPAPELKSRLTTFLHNLITEGKAIPFDEKLNPYMILIEWEKDKPLQVYKRVKYYLEDKIREYPQHRALWITQHVQVLCKLELHGELLDLVDNYEGEIAMYEALKQHGQARDLDKNVIRSLKRQYAEHKNRHIKSSIFQILQNQKNEPMAFTQLAIQEYFLTGDINIIVDLMDSKEMSKEDLVREITTFSRQHPEAEPFHLYTAYKFLGQDELLKNSLMQEEDIYEILPFLDIIYPTYREEVEQKLASLMETYLQSHFGRPALNHINAILDEINRSGQGRLIDFLLRNIRHQFGHRKHFQKLMKELVQ